jgi:PAS domain S-box-containing protein
MDEGLIQEFETRGTSGKWYRIRVFPSELGISVFWQDVTERKQAEEALRLSEEKYRNLVESSSDYIWEANKNGVCTYANPRIYDILGYRPEEVIGKTPFDLMPPEEVKRVLPIFQQCVSQGTPIRSLEYLICHKDGHLVFVENNGTPFNDADGILLGYRGIDRDITERKKAEAALAKAKDELEMRVQERTAELSESEEKYRNLVENTSELVVVFQEGIIKFVNNRGLEITATHEKD